VCLELAHFGFSFYSHGNFVPVNCSQFSATHKWWTETKDENEKKINDSFGDDCQRVRNVFVRANERPLGGEENSLLHLLHAPLGQIGQTRQLLNLRHEPGAGL
jgi:hypothetical protein